MPFLTAQQAEKLLYVSNTIKTSTNTISGYRAILGDGTVVNANPDAVYRLIGYCISQGYTGVILYNIRSWAASGNFASGTSTYTAVLRDFITKMHHYGIKVFASVHGSTTPDINGFIAYNNNCPHPMQRLDGLCPEEEFWAGSPTFSAYHTNLQNLKASLNSCGPSAANSTNPSLYPPGFSGAAAWANGFPGVGLPIYAYLGNIDNATSGTAITDLQASQVLNVWMLTCYQGKPNFGRMVSRLTPLTAGGNSINVMWLISVDHDDCSTVGTANEYFSRPFMSGQTAGTWSQATQGAITKHGIIDCYNYITRIPANAPETTFNPAQAGGGSFESNQASYPLVNVRGITLFMYNDDNDNTSVGVSTRDKGLFSEDTYSGGSCTGGTKTKTYVLNGSETHVIVGSSIYTVTSRSRTTNVATLTITGHPFNVGDTIIVDGVDTAANGSVFNGIFVVTSTTATTVSYTTYTSGTIAAGAPPAGATIYSTSLKINVGTTSVNLHGEAYDDMLAAGSTNAGGPTYNTLSYAWCIVSRPSGSGTGGTFSNPSGTLSSTSVAPASWSGGKNSITTTFSGFSNSVSGTYVLRLLISDDPNSPATQSACTGSVTARYQDFNLVVTSGTSAPTITAGGPTTFCYASGNTTQNSVTLTSSAASGNSWSLNGVSTGQTTQSIVVTGVRFDVSNKSATAGVGTLTLPGHTFRVGDVVYVAGVDTNFNGSHTITSIVAGTSISFAVGSAQASVASAGQVTLTTMNYTVTAAALTSATTTVTVNYQPTTLIDFSGTTTVPAMTPSNGIACSPNSVVVGPVSSATNAGGQTGYYRWQKNGVDINTTTYPSAATNTLTVDPTLGSGNYTVYTTSAAGCSSAPSAAAVVTINTAATPTITVSGPTTLCQGSSGTTLTSSVASSYLWAPNGETTRTITPTTSGSYTVTASTGGCSATSAPVAITVNPNPSVPTITAGGPTTFCQGGSVTLTSSITGGSGTIPTYDKIIIVIGENTEDSEVTAANSPYLKNLASQGVYFSQMYALQHTSQTDYMHLFTGTTNHYLDSLNAGALVSENVTYNTYPPDYFQTPHIGSTLRLAGKSLDHYSETLPLTQAINTQSTAPGGTTDQDSGKYARKHSYIQQWRGTGHNQLNGGHVQFSVDQKSQSATTATIRTTATHSMIVGNVISVLGIGAPFNGTFVVTGVTSNTISYTVTTSATVAATSVNPVGVVWKSSGTTVTNNFGRNLAFSQFPTSNFATNLADLTIISPDLCGDQHDLCSNCCNGGNGGNSGSGFGSGNQYKQFNDWCATNLPNIVSYVSNPVNNALLIITFDEGSVAPLQNHIFTCFYGAHINNGTTVSTMYNHYSLLRTIGTALGASYHPGNAANATNAATINGTGPTTQVSTTMTGFWTGTETPTWHVSPAGNDPTNNGATTQAITVSAGAGTGTSYTVTATDSTTGCSSTSAATIVTVNAIPATPTIQIVSGTTSLCPGQTVVLGTTTTSPGGYLWSGPAPFNGATTATISVNYSQVATPGTFSVRFTQTGCNSAASNNVVVSQASALTASVTIGANPGTTVCAGTNVTFTAVPTNGGTPTYQWQVFTSAWNNVGTNSSTYTTNSLVTGNQVRCIMTSSNACVTNSPVTSNVLTMTVNPSAPVSVTINPSTASPVCQGIAVTYTATPTNGGASPSYAWYKDGILVQSGASSTYIDPNTNPGATVIRVDLTSNAACATGNPATASYNMTVTAPPVAPTITSPNGSNPNQTICTAGSIVLTSTNPSGGTYQWYNGASAIGGQTSSTLTVTTAGVYTCKISLNGCTSASSNSITITVTASQPVSVTISGPSTFCAGTAVTYTAAPTNGGSSPSYQWQVFTGTWGNVGTNSNTYTTSTLAAGQQVRCILTSNSACATGNPATSNVISPTVTANVTASVSIAASPSNVICQGTSVTFTATPTNGGASPVYQWFNGATPVGSNSNTYTTSALTNGNVITCQMTSNATCVTGNPATSNSITMSVTNTPATPTISPSGTVSLCSGGSVNLVSSAAPSPGGSYLWSTGATTQSINVTTAGTYTVQVGQNGCLSASSAGTVVTVSASQPVSVTIAANPGSTVCSGTTVTYTATPVNPGVSPVYQWKKNGSNVGSNSPTYSVVPVNGDVITCVLTSSSSCATGNPATSNAITMTVTASVSASISIAANPGTSVCAGTSVTFTATPTNGGVSPAYQWKVNGSNVGTNSSTYTTSSLVNNDNVTCVLTSNASCVSNSPVTSNTLTMNITSAQTAGVSIAASATTVCAGTAVTFTATPTNGGLSPQYNWLKNGVSQIVGSSASYTLSSPTNGDTITCIMTSSLSCTANNPATSNAISLTVTPTVTPTITISGTSTICAGTTVTFSSSITNGGTTPSYQWVKNGVDVVGAISSNFTTGVLANGDTIACKLTSNANCATVATVTSTAITMTVTPIAVPSVVVSASTTSICSGDSVTFTATPTNGGLAPIYQWKLNGSINVGTGSNSFTTSTLGSGDQISVVMTSNATCAAPLTATSNSVTITVSASALTAVTIAASPSGAVCAGTSVTYTATPLNGGASPTYQWVKNGVNVGTNSSTYTNASPTNGDSIHCVMVSSLTCVDSGSSPSNTSTSNTITTTVNNNVTASVSIAKTVPSGNPCANEAVTFVATPTNGGTAPTYQWFINGIPKIGATSSSFITTTLADQDIVSCTMTSNAPCVSGNPATSNSIQVTVNSNAPVTVSISVSPAQVINAGQTATFTATPVNGGGSPGYRWIVSGVDTGITTQTFTTNGLINGDSVQCELTSSSVCVSGNPAMSNTIVMTVITNNVPASFAAIIFPQGPTSFLAGGSVDLKGNSGPNTWSYIWSTGETTQTITAGTSGRYSLTLYDSATNRYSTTAYADVIVKSLDDPAINKIADSIDIDDKTASFAVVRANPKISGNVKITIDSKGKLWLNSFDANKELSASQFKRFPIAATSSFESDLWTFFNKGATPPSIVFGQYEKKPNITAISDTLKDQYDFFYAMGAAPLISSQYEEEYSYLAPIWLREQLPDYFVIFRIDDPIDYPYNNNVLPGNIEAGIEYKVVGTNYKVRYAGRDYKDGFTFKGIAGQTMYSVINGSGKVISLNENKDNPISISDEFRHMLKKAAAIKTFDLTDNSNIGKYIRNIKNSGRFPASPLSARFDGDLMTTWNGISYQDGVITSKGELLSDYWSSASTQISFEEYITGGFERHGIISPALLNLEFLFTDETANKYSIPRYFGFYVNKLKTGEFQIDGHEMYNQRNLSGNMPIPKRDNKGYRHQEEAYHITNENGIKIYYTNENGFIPTSQTFTTYFEERFYWIQDREGMFHSYESYPESYNPAQVFNINNKDIVLKDKSIDLGKFTGHGTVKLQAKGSTTKEKGRAYFVITINDELTPNDEIRLYWNIGSQNDADGKYDIVVANDLTSVVTDWGPGSHLGHDYIHPYGKTKEIASALAKALNALPARTFDAISINNEVVIRMKAGGTAPNSFFIKTSLANNSHVSLQGSVSTSGDKYYFEGGTDLANTRMIYPLDDINILKDGEVFAKTKYGMSKIIHVGRYVDSPIIEKSGSEIIGLKDFDKLGVFSIENPLDSVVLGHSKEFIAYELYKIPTGLFSFFPVKEMDGDFWSSTYGRTPVQEYHRYFDLIAGENCLIPYRTYLVLGNDGDYITYDGVSPNIVTVDNVTYPNGTPFVAVPGVETFAIGSGSPVVVPRIFYGNATTWNILDEYFLQTAGTDVNPYTAYGSTSDSIIITPSFGLPTTIQPTLTGTVFTVADAPGTYTVQIVGTPLIIVGDVSRGGLEPDPDLKSFPGFASLKNFSTIDDERIDRNTITFQHRDKFFHKDLLSEYDYLKENFTKEAALKSRVVPTISKWVYAGGLDIRDNPYRLNVHQVFGEQNFSPSFVVRTQSPEAFTHEWYYLEYLPQQYPDAYKKYNYAYFDGPIDFEWLTDADPSLRSHFDYYFKFQPAPEVPLQERYAIMKFNDEIGLSEGFFRGVKFRIKEIIRETLSQELRGNKPAYKENSARFDGYKFSALLRAVKEDPNKIQEPVTIQFIENKTTKSITLLIDVVVEDYRTLELKGNNNLANSFKYPERIPTSQTLWDFNSIANPTVTTNVTAVNQDPGFDNPAQWIVESNLNGSTSGLFVINSALEQSCDSNGLAYNIVWHNFNWPSTLTSPATFNITFTTGKVSTGNTNLYLVLPNGGSCVTHLIQANPSDHQAYTMTMTLSIDNTAPSTCYTVDAQNRFGIALETTGGVSGGTTEILDFSIDLVESVTDDGLFYPEQLSNRLDYLLLYSMKSKFKEGLYFDTAANIVLGSDVHITADIKLSFAVDLATSQLLSDGYGINIYPNVNYDFDVRDEIKNFGIRNSFIGQYRFGQYAMTNPVSSTQSGFELPLTSEFIAPTASASFVSIPFGSSYVWQDFPTTQLEGGIKYYEPIMQRISFASLAKKINEYSPYVKYRTFSWNGSTTVETQNEFYIELMEPSVINKKETLIPQIDTDVPQEFKNESVIGVNHIKISTSHDMKRYTGPYEPKFKDIFFFKRPKVDQIIGPDLDLSFKNATFNSSADDFAILKNMGINKVANKEVLVLGKNKKFKPLYPLLHEVPVDKCDFSVIKSSWDPGFYRMYATKETFKPQAGTREMLELKNFFGTKIMKTPAVVRLESFTTREYSGIVPTLDGAKPDQFAEELVFIKDNKKITGMINLKKRLLRYLVEDGANAEFVRLLMSEFGTGDPDTFNDDVIDYLTLNIIPTYETKVVDLYIKKVKQPGGTYGQNTVRGDLSDVQKLLDGYKLDKNFKVTKKADLIYTFEYQIDKSFGAELAPSFTIGKI